MENKDLKLSIIVPIYNVERYVRGCVSSLYRQGFAEEEFEVILVNDGSLDGSMEVLAPIQEQHNNIKVINQPNQGQASARNNAMECAQGEYVFFIDSDDMLVDNSLKPLLCQLMESGADTIQGGYVKIDDKDFPNQGLSSEQVAHEVIIRSGKEHFMADSAYDCYVWQNIYKKEFLLSAGLKFVPGVFFEDVAYYGEMLIKAERYAVSSIKHYVYRQREGSTMTTMNKEKLIHMNIVNEHLWNRCKDIVGADKKYHDALVNRIFCSTVSVNFWYVTHYRNIYPYWKEILNDLKRRIPLDVFDVTYKQRCTVACLKYFPGISLWIRYKLNQKKYG